MRCLWHLSSASFEQHPAAVNDISLSTDKLEVGSIFPFKPPRLGNQREILAIGILTGIHWGAIPLVGPILRRMSALNLFWLWRKTSSLLRNSQHCYWFDLKVVFEKFLFSYGGFFPYFCDRFVHLKRWQVTLWEDVRSLLWKASFLQSIFFLGKLGGKVHRVQSQQPAILLTHVMFPRTNLGDLACDLAGPSDAREKVRDWGYKLFFLFPGSCAIRNDAYLWYRPLHVLVGFSSRLYIPNSRDSAFICSACWALSLHLQNPADCNFIRDCLSFLRSWRADNARCFVTSCVTWPRAGQHGPSYSNVWFPWHSHLVQKEKIKTLSFTKLSGNS